MSCSNPMNELGNLPDWPAAIGAATSPKPVRRAALIQRTLELPPTEAWKRDRVLCAAILSYWIKDPKQVKKVGLQDISNLAAAGGDQAAQIAAAYIDTKDPKVFHRVIELLGKTNTPRSIPVYLHALKTFPDDEALQDAAIACIAQNGAESIVPLTCALNGPDIERAKIALNFLCQMRQREALHAVLHRLLHPDCHPELRQEIDSCLARMSPSRWLDELLSFTQEQSAAIRKNAWSRLEQFARTSRQNAWKIKNYRETIASAASSDTDDTARKIAMRVLQVIERLDLSMTGDYRY